MLLWCIAGIQVQEAALQLVQLHNSKLLCILFKDDDVATVKLQPHMLDY